jgi:hypothetical protein
MKYSPRVTSGLRPCVIDWPREHTHTNTHNIYITRKLHDTHTYYMHVCNVHYYYNIIPNTVIYCLDYDTL